MDSKNITLAIHTPRAPWQMPLDRHQLMAVLSAMAEEAVPGADFELILVDDRAIAELNAAYLSCPGPTNIITFPVEADNPGSMYLSLDCLHRECLIYGQKPLAHMLRLLAHGFGHLAGLDHGSEMDNLAEACYAAGSRAIQDFS